MSSTLDFLRFKTFTGWHMLVVMVLFFGTIVSVNLTMAYFATSSWSGLLVQNTYVASQKFDDDVAQNREMLERGWVSDLTMDGSTITYSLADGTGQPVFADTVTASVYRPVGVLDDQSVTMTQSGEGTYSAALAVDPGQWIARISAQKDGMLVYREVHRLELPMDSGR